MTPADPPEPLDAAIQRFRAICESPQAVRIVGIPPCRFAATMLEADYKLKQIADGTIRPLPQLNSLAQAELQSALALARQGKEIAGSSYSRFWFVAGDCVHSTAQITTTLDRCDVGLLTEEELTTSSGAMTSAGKKNTLASNFACEVSKIFPDLASADATYLNLETLYQWMAVARVMIDNKTVERSGLNISVLLDKLPIDPANILPTVPGRFALGSEEIRNGNVINKLRLPSCGGVEMAFPEGKVAKARGDTEKIEQWGKLALEARERVGIGAAHWAVL